MDAPVFSDTTLTGDENPEPELDETVTIAPVDAPSALCNVRGCTNPVKPYGGRGKHPTRCVDHSSGGTGASRGSGGRGRWQEALTDSLAASFVGIGTVVYAFDQFDGQVIVQGSPRLAESLVTLAETDAKVRRALERMVKGGAWTGVAIAVAGIAVPILAHHELLPFKLNATVDAKPSPNGGDPTSV